MAWIAGYTVHTWEMAVVRGWAVVFFTTVIAWHGSPWWLPDPTVLFTVAGLAGVLVSVTGNETAQRWGRQQVVMVAMTVAASLSLIAGWTAAISTPLAVVVLVLWNAAIYLDSSALTVGTVQAADPKLRGATMGLHSMCGYARRLCRPASCRLGARSCRPRQCGRVGPRLRPSRHHHADRLRGPAMAEHSEAASGKHGHCRLNLSDPASAGKDACNMAPRLIVERWSNPMSAVGA
jgi:hypothetical protein